MKTLAHATNRSEANLVNAAVDAYLDAQSWAADHIRRAVEYADSPQAEWVAQDELERRWVAREAEPVE